ncbi:unnamed protein product [Spirodela intermedia]|uniref:Uncharacterized protein n=2 Tax=Spirodela intermedia TaxID=51605 RepID=A0A7I8IH89_SPIIN|nr:unnamed protein product [Spirodela intermedia]CAA6657232.1 unnamed protein product [Spirodela intermedia]CAA7393262.1 unnamed protein product [Spirodela intermedia]
MSVPACPIYPNPANHG